MSNTRPQLARDFDDEDSFHSEVSEAASPDSPEDAVPMPTWPAPAPPPTVSRRPASEEPREAAAKPRSAMMKAAMAALALLVVAQAGVIAGLIWWPPLSKPAGVSETAVGGPSVLTAQTGVVPSAPAGATDPVQSGVPATPPGGSEGQPPVASPPPPAAVVAPVASGIDVASDPPGARVTVNGERRGVTPLSLQLGAGQYTVVVSDGKSSATRTVAVPEGGRVSFIAALAAAGPGAGWLTIAAPMEFQVSEGGALLGTTSAARIMLPAGKHQLELANAAIGYQTSVAVEIQPGKTTAATVTVPNGSLSINALPWANVFVDGKAVGTTPLANLEVPLGTHEIVSRHPQLGERRQTVTVTSKTPVRVVMDLRK